MEMLLQFEEMIGNWLAHDAQQRRLRSATRRAWNQFAAENTDAVRSLFDEHFVLVRVLPMLQDAVQTNTTVTPAMVAESWARQISILPDMRRRHVEQMLPAAARFLALVADELGHFSATRREPLAAKLSAAF